MSYDHQYRKDSFADAIVDEKISISDYALSASVSFVNLVRSSDAELTWPLL